MDRGRRAPLCRRRARPRWQLLAPDFCRGSDLGIAMTAADLSALGLPQVFSPADAAGVLRGLGLRDITECALRTRAYRKQVPFHRNGRRIVFTVDDLREIAEGEAHRPPVRVRAASHAGAPPSASHRPLPASHSKPDGAWRARVPVRPGSDGRSSGR